MSLIEITDGIVPEGMGHQQLNVKLMADNDGYFNEAALDLVSELLVEDTVRQILLMKTGVITKLRTTVHSDYDDYVFSYASGFNRYIRLDVSHNETGDHQDVTVADVISMVVGETTLISSVTTAVYLEGLFLRCLSVDRLVLMICYAYEQIQDSEHMSDVKSFFHVNKADMLKIIHDRMRRQP